MLPSLHSSLTLIRFPTTTTTVQQYMCFVFWIAKKRLFPYILQRAYQRFKSNEKFAAINRQKRGITESVFLIC
jgi:hypothetical protein